MRRSAGEGVHRSQRQIFLFYVLTEFYYCYKYRSIPIRLRGVLEAKPDVNGERRPRAGSQACSRESLEGSLPAHYEAQGQCPLHLPAIGESCLRGQKEVGHQGLKTPQWSAVRRTGFAQPVRALARARGGYICAVTALRSLSWEQRRAPALSGSANREDQQKLGRDFPPRDGRDVAV